MEAVKDLSDGSWLADVFDSIADRRRQHPVKVRVVGYTIDDGRDPTNAFQLITTLLDHRKAPGSKLAAAYAQRWEIETAFDELKTHQRRARAVLRSKSPGLIPQEIWGHLCCHYAIRSLMFDAPRTPATTRTGCRSSPRYASPAGPLPSRALFPLSKATPSGGSSDMPSANSSAGSYRADASEPTPASSNASTPGGTSNEHSTETGPNPTDHRPKPW